MFELNRAGLNSSDFYAIKWEPRQSLSLNVLFGFARFTLAQYPDREEYDKKYYE
jgi:hypothetical protein